MPIKHGFVSAKPDPPDLTLIKGSDWNADHNYPAYSVFGIQMGDDPYVTRNPPAGIDEPYSGGHRTKVDLSQCATARVVGNPTLNTGSVASKLACQYSLDQVTWNYLDGVNGPFILLFPLGVKFGAWVNLAAPAKADVWLRWITVGGTGNSTQWHHHYLQVR